MEDQPASRGSVYYCSKLFWLKRWLRMWLTIVTHMQTLKCACVACVAMHACTHACMHGSIVTQAMSAGPALCDVISLSCLVSACLAYPLVSLQLSEAEGSKNWTQPAGRLHLHPSLHLSSHLTLLYKMSFIDIQLSDRHDRLCPLNNRTPKNCKYWSAIQIVAGQGFKRPILNSKQFDPPARVMLRHKYDASSACMCAAAAHRLPRLSPSAPLVSPRPVVPTMHCVHVDTSRHREIIFFLCPLSFHIMQVQKVHLPSFLPPSSFVNSFSYIFCVHIFPCYFPNDSMIIN